MENNFPENLIKGKIVETIFQQMFLETEKYNVYPTGYETSLPQIAQLRHHKDIESILDRVRKTPDFVLVPKDKDGFCSRSRSYNDSAEGCSLSCINAAYITIR